MTKVNKPRVRILIGKVRITRMGLTIKVKIPQTMEETIRADQPLMKNPGTR